MSRAAKSFEALVAIHRIATTAKPGARGTTDMASIAVLCQQAIGDRTYQAPTVMTVAVQAMRAEMVETPDNDEDRSYNNGILHAIDALTASAKGDRAALPTDEQLGKAWVDWTRAWSETKGSNWGSEESAIGFVRQVLASLDR